MYYDDANIQIIGYNSSELNLFEEMQVKDIITKFNEDMRYKNVIKKQKEEIDKLKKELNKEQLKEQVDWFIKFNNEVVKKI